VKISNKLIKQREQACVVVVREEPERGKVLGKESMLFCLKNIKKYAVWQTMGGYHRARLSRGCVI